MRTKNINAEDLEIFVYSHGQKIFETKGKPKKVNKEFNEFKRFKIF